MKIKHRITLISVVLCMVCVLAMWSANRFISGIYLETTLQDKLSAEAKLKAHEINAWIGREKQNLEIIAERVIWAENHEFNTLYKVLEKSAAMNYGNLNYLALEDGTFVDVSGWVPDEGYNPLTREWYVKAAENAGKIYVCDPYGNHTTGHSGRGEYRRAE